MAIKNIASFLFLFFMLKSGFGQKHDSLSSKISILPVPTFGYEPELSFYAGAVALINMDFYQDTLTRTSNLNFEFTYTLNRQWIAEIEWVYFAREDHLISEGVLKLRYFPYVFYGVGNDTREETGEIIETKDMGADITVLRKIRPGFFGGVNFLGNRVFEPDNPGPWKNSVIPGLQTGGMVLGAGFVFRWDTRDNILNPSRGTKYLQGDVLKFSEAWGSDFTFNRYSIDARAFLRALRKKDVLAVQLKTMINDGNVPYFMMGMLGGNEIMRGFYSGRYRDKLYTAAQVEYRAPVFWRIGVVGFAGTGRVARGLTRLSLDGWKFSGGGGLRFLIDRKNNVNLRIDYARGTGHSSGFYFSFGEAF